MRDGGAAQDWEGTAGAGQQMGTVHVGAWQYLHGRDLLRERYALPYGHQAAMGDRGVELPYSQGTLQNIGAAVAAHQVQQVGREVQQLQQVQKAVKETKARHDKGAAQALGQDPSHIVGD